VKTVECLFQLTARKLDTDFENQQQPSLTRNQCNGHLQQMLMHYVTTFRGLRQRGAHYIAASRSSSCLGPGPAPPADADVSKGIWRCAATATESGTAATEAHQLSGPAAGAGAAAAAAPARHYLPAATTAVLLPPTAQLTLHISSSQIGQGATQVLVS
jgi:hypothetical protein